MLGWMASLGVCLVCHQCHLLLLLQLIRSLTGVAVAPSPSQVLVRISFVRFQIVEDGLGTLHVQLQELLRALRFQLTANTEIDVRRCQSPHRVEMEGIRYSQRIGRAIGSCEAGASGHYDRFDGLRLLS